MKSEPDLDFSPMNAGQRNCHLIYWNHETQQDPVGLLCTEAFLCLHHPHLAVISCVWEINRLSPPRPSLSSKGQVQTVADQGREEMQRQGRSSRLGGGPWSPCKGYTELFFRTKTLNTWKINLMKHSSFQTQGHSLITLRITEAHQETIWGQIKGVLALHTPWSLSATPPPKTIPIKLPTKPPHLHGGTQVFIWGH